MLIHIIKRRIPDGLWQSSISIGGNFFGTGLSALALIILSRSIGPTRFGEFSVGFAIIMILNKLNDAGLNATLLKFVPQASDDHTHANQIFAYTAKLKLIIAGLILVVGLGVSPWLAETLHFSEPSIIYLSFILSFASTAYEHLLTMLQSVYRFTQAVWVNLLQSSTKLLGALALFFITVPSNVPVFVFYMLAPIVPLLLSRKLLPNWVNLKPNQDFSSVKTPILNMAKHSAIGFIAAGLIENIDLLFIQRYLSSYETGLMAGVSKIAAMVLLIAYSLGNVLYPRVARYHERQDLLAYIKKAFGLLVLVAFGYVLFLPFGRLLILLTVGPEYVDGVNILYLLTASAFLSIATIPFLALFYTLKADWYFSVSGILQLLIILIGNALFVPTMGLEAAAWTRLILRLFLFIFTAGVGLGLYYRKYHARSV